MPESTGLVKLVKDITAGTCGEWVCSVSLSDGSRLTRRRCTHPNTNPEIPPHSHYSSIADVGGISVTLVGHPFDTLKVRLQTQPMDKPIYCELQRLCIMELLLSSHFSSFLRVCMSALMR